MTDGVVETVRSPAHIEPGSAPPPGRSQHDNPLLANNRAARGDKSFRSADVHRRIAAIRDPQPPPGDGRPAGPDGSPGVETPHNEPEPPQPGVPTSAAPDDPPPGDGTGELPANGTGEDGLARFTVADLAAALEMEPAEFYEQFGLSLAGAGENGESRFVTLSQLKDVAQVLVETGGNLEDINARISEAQSQPDEIRQHYADLDRARGELAQHKDQVVAAHRQSQEQLQLASNILLNLRSSLVDESLRASDPAAYLMQKQWFDEALQTVQAHQQHAAQNAKEMAERELANSRKYAWREFLKHHPSWREREVAEREQSKLRSFLSTRYGFSETELRRLGDHRLMLMALDAQQHHSNRKAVNLDNKLSGLRSIKSLKPGARAAVGSDPQATQASAEAHQTLVDAHRANPRSRDALVARLSNLRQQGSLNDGSG